MAAGRVDPGRKMDRMESVHEYLESLAGTGTKSFDLFTWNFLHKLARRRRDDSQTINFADDDCRRFIRIAECGQKLSN